MEQVAQIVSGERDYTRIRGGTGPLVYPAAHVHIYTGLYRLTDEGRNVLAAQKIFAGVYLAALAVAMACYLRARVRPPHFGMVKRRNLLTEDGNNRSRRMSCPC